MGIAALSQPETIRLFVNHLKDDAAGPRKQGAWLLGVLASSADNKLTIAKAGAIPILVDLLQDGSSGVREQAAMALGNLAVLNAENKISTGRSRAIPPLVSLLADPECGVREHAVHALDKLGILNSNNRTEMVHAGVIPSLVRLVRDDAQLRKLAKGALQSFADEDVKFKFAIQKAADAAKCSLDGLKL